MKIFYIHLFPILCALCCLSFLACSESQEAQTPPPNILWIIAEDLSPDLGCYGHPLVYTPNIDALAAQGVRFTQVFTTAPVCSPSRTALATGMYQTAINAHHMRYPDELKHDLPSEVIPLNELMRRKGYQTANIKSYPGRGKTDWSFRSDLAKYGIDQWDGLDVRKPFFAVVNLGFTHRPFDRDSINPIDPSQVNIPPYYPDHPVTRQDWTAYLESVQLLDGQVGYVLEELAIRGLAKNTIVFFFSDHGRPMTRAKNYHYDTGNHIPLIISCPPKLDWHSYLPPGTVDDRLISSIDLTASTLAFASGQKPEWMQGRVLFGEQTEPGRQYVFCASDRIGGTFFKSRSVRSKEYKYIRNFNRDFSVNSSATAYRKQMHPIFHVLNIYSELGKLTPAQQALMDPMPEELLFDLAADPFETRNLATDPDYAELLEEMRKELTDWQERTTDHGMNPDSEELIQAFDTYRTQSASSRADKIQAVEQSIRSQIQQSMN